MQVAADISRLQESAGEAAEMLRLLANENRLLILCQLAMEREMPVGALAAGVGLSQSALSQHLARMRREGLVATRREGTTVFYRIGDTRVRRVLTLLKNLYCP
ncbi:MAG: ArsR/SmtB family transcription factor [Reyranellaceae bacterium]